MRILVFNYEYPPIGGGGGVAARDLAEAWVASGHKVTVVTSLYKNLPARERVNGVSVVRVPVLLRNKAQTASYVSMVSYVPSSIFHCLSTKELQNFDIVNTHFAIPSGPAGQTLARFLKIPNVLSVHGGDIFDPSKSLSPHKTPLLCSVVTAMLNRANRVVAQSSDTCSKALQYYKVDKRIDIIPLGIKKPVINKVLWNNSLIDQDDFVLCTIGRLVKRKNLDELFTILAQLKKRIRFKLIVIGEGHEKSKLMDTVNRLELKNQVIFTGAVDDDMKYRYLKRADIYVSTTAHEGFGLTFLEAMECGLPVVCYNIGGQNDFLINEKTGFLVEFGDKQAFAEKIEKLSSNRSLKDFMASFCSSHIENYYIENCANRYISLFNEVIGEKVSQP